MATYNPLTLTKSAVASSLDTLTQYAENIDTRYRDLPGSRDADDGSSTNPHSTIGRTIAEFRNQVSPARCLFYVQTVLNTTLTGQERKPIHDGLDDDWWSVGRDSTFRRAR